MARRLTYRQAVELNMLDEFDRQEDADHKAILDAARHDSEQYQKWVYEVAIPAYCEFVEKMPMNATRRFTDWLAEYESECAASVEDYCGALDCHGRP